ncbi:MAG: hypothetical protein ACOCXH_12490 [Cyclobacteriaceae bacterium]
MSTKLWKFNSLMLVVSEASDCVSGLNIIEMKIEWFSCGSVSN